MLSLESASIQIHTLSIVNGKLGACTRGLSKRGSSKTWWGPVRGALNVVRSSRAANTSAARRRVAIGYGAWKLARTAGRETHTTSGPQTRAQRGVVLR